MKASLSTKLKAALPALVAAAAFAQSPATSAAVIGFDPTGTSTYTSTDLWTNVTDSALAVGFIPGLLVPPAPQYDIRLISQARVGSFSLGPDIVFPGGLIPNFHYEVTKVLDIQERVISQDATNVNFGNAVQIADVDPTTPGLQQLAIFLDDLVPDGTDPSKAVPGNGAGTVRCYGAGATSATCGSDGVLIMSARLVNNVSSFAASGAIGTGSFDLTFVIDFVNPAYLDVKTGSIFGEKITGTTNVPSQFLPAVMWDGTATSTGLLLKVDSSQSFLASVPEPGSLALIGLGLAGLGAGLLRRRRPEVE